MAVTGEENIYFEMESKQDNDEQVDDGKAGKSSTTTGTPAAKQTTCSLQEITQGIENKQQRTKNVVTVRGLLFVIAFLIVLSFLATVATLILALRVTRTMSGNVPTASAPQGLQGDNTQTLIELKEEIRQLKENLTGGPSANDLFSDLKQQLTGIKKEFCRAVKKNQTGDCGGVYKNCAHVYKCGQQVSGVYKIDPDNLSAFEVFCDQKTAGGGWTVFQKRQDGSVDFYRGWADYKRGFGNLNGEFWLGLDKIHRLTVSDSNNLRVDLKRPGKTIFAEYSSFSVGSELEKFKLSLRNYSGNATDCLIWHHNGQAFSTKDRDNEQTASWNLRQEAFGRLVVQWLLYIKPQWCVLQYGCDQ